MTAEAYQPDALLAQFRELERRTLVQDFFCKPGGARLREMWCAAHFSRAFAKEVAPRTVWFSGIDTQDDVDFELEVEGVVYPFQVAEVLNPDRRRGDEYRNFVQERTQLEDWGPGTEFGPEWIREAIVRKLDKNYAREATLNLLLYLNYFAYSQDYHVIRNHCQTEASRFASVWLLNGEAFACLAPHAALGRVEAWLAIPQSPL